MGFVMEQLEPLAPSDTGGYSLKGFVIADGDTADGDTVDVDADDNAVREPLQDDPAAQDAYATIETACGLQLIIPSPLEPHLETEVLSNLVVEESPAADDFSSGEYAPLARRLAAALVGDMIETLTRPRLRAVPESSRRKNGKPSKTTERAIENDLWWLHYDGEGLCSFRWCCELLGLDPTSVRSFVEDSIREGRYIRMRLRCGPLGDFSIRDVLPGEKA